MEVPLLNKWFICTVSAFCYKQNINICDKLVGIEISKILITTVVSGVILTTVEIQQRTKIFSKPTLLIVIWLEVLPDVFKWSVFLQLRAKTCSEFHDYDVFVGFRFPKYLIKQLH